MEPNQSAPEQPSPAAEAHTNAPAKRRAGLGRQILIGLAIGLIGLAIFMDGPPQNAANTPAAPATETATSTAPLAEVKTQTSRFKADGTAARELLQEINKSPAKANLQRTFDQAIQYAKSGEPLNAYLLWFYSARKGHALSAMKLAEMADPLHPDTPNHNTELYQAFKWYKVAADAGDKEATARLAALKTWTETQASNGDAAAKRLLLQWQTKNGQIK